MYSLYTHIHKFNSHVRFNLVSNRIFPLYKVRYGKDSQFYPSYSEYSCYGYYVAFLKRLPSYKEIVNLM